MKSLVRVRALVAPAFLGALVASATAQETPFPQEITVPEAKIVVYQPQPEKLAGNVLTGRAAMSLVPTGKAEPIFGAFWFTSVIDTDAESRTVLIRDIKVTRARWPDSKAEDERRFTQVVEAAAAKSGLTISTDRLAASLKSAEREQESLAALKNDPPKIVFANELAVLLLYDGQPVWGDVETSPYERALNTPYVVVREKHAKTSWLSSGQLWYTSGDPLSGWQPATNPPADLVKMLPKPESDDPVPARPPRIVVATEPTELIVTDGEPKWKSVSAGELLYVENTETPWLREVASGQMYVLLSGRWFRAKASDGPWAFVRPDQLPEAFKKIPPGSDISGVRVSVAGTGEAEDALLDGAIPQTTAVKRSEARFEAQYQGEPKFEPIPGTSVKNAVNTPAQVLQVGDRYYAVDNGVWFVSSSAKGPWAVADTVPEDEIQKIPASSPTYNVTHVHVYQSTPEVVYVGYTPGYRWAFPYYGVPVYGTGYYYPRYPGYYYPRPATFGFHVGYNPWTGWNFGMSWNVGFMHFGMRWGGGYGGNYRPGYGCGGWYGGYRPGWGGYRGGHNTINVGSINIGNNINYGNRTRVANNIRNNPSFNRQNVSRDNIYNRAENRARNADRATVQRNVQQARSNRGLNNDVLADRNGNVVRKTPSGWEARDGNKWQNIDKDAARQKAQGVDRGQVQQRAQNVDRDAARQRAQQVDRSQVQQDWQNRQRGRERETAQRQVPRSAPQQRSQPRSRPSGGGARSRR
ncbi:MAG TPA: hypothetical protein VER75_04590 [Thermoleophilaceae bacterium]|nr:hypothetical protein [Thermoleophilaceae bacterium]